MDPISNKKEFEDLTANLRDLAYSYIEKYNPSKQQIKIYLLKKYLKKFQSSKAKKEISLGSLGKLFLPRSAKGTILSPHCKMPTCFPQWPMVVFRSNLI